MGTKPRFQVEPRDVPPEMVARRLGLTLAAYREKESALYARGFPRPDPDTGNTDLDAIDAWRRTRNPHLFGIAPLATARDARAVVADRIARM